MKTRCSTLAVLALGALLSIGLPTYSLSPAGNADDIPWYYDAETALQVAKKSERPIVVLKIRADIGPDVKT